MTTAELEAKVLELEAKLVARAGKTETEKDSYGCRAGTMGYAINKEISKILAGRSATERGKKIDPNVIFHALNGEIELRRIKQQLPYLAKKGLI